MTREASRSKATHLACVLKAARGGVVAQVQRMLLKSESISPAVGQFSRMVTAAPLMTLYVLLRVMPLIRRASLSRLC